MPYPGDLPQRLLRLAQTQSFLQERRNQALRRRLVELHEKYPALGLDSLYRMVKPEFGCSRKRVRRQMRLAGITSVRRQTCKATTHSNHKQSIAANLLNRNFAFACPNQAWVGDITRKGDLHDNAVAENFFSCLKCELLHLHQYSTRAAAQADIFAYVEAFYNTKRPHSALGWLPPARFEALLRSPAAA